MKYSLLDLLRSPKTNGLLELKNKVEKNGEIFEGTLHCVQSGATFPIIKYIPRLVDETNYSASWGKLWSETGEILRDSFTKIPFHYNVIHGKYSEESGLMQRGFSPFGFGWPTDLSGETVLEVGPGTGNCTEHLVNTNANLICVDMSNAIDTLPEELLTQPNINVIQADINDPIFPTDTFDRIWLFQVLQHTPSPPGTLKTMWELLRKGGKIAFTSYVGRYNPWYYQFTKRINDEVAWKLIAYWTPKLVSMKYRLQKTGLSVISKVAVALLHPIDPRNIYFSTLEGQANEYIHGAIWNQTNDKDLLMKYVILNTFDRITPEHTNSASHKDIEKWTLDANFSSVKTWGKSGVRAVAIK